MDIDNSKQIYDSTKAIKSVCYKLEGLALAFSTTGNHDLCQRLMRYVETLEQAIVDIERANSNINTERFREAEQASANVLNAALAGIALKEKE